MAWEMETTDIYPGNRAKKFGKSYEIPVGNMLSNLATYVATLAAGSHPEQAKRLLPFVHEEKQGLVAVDQRPPVKGVQLRLYLYPCMKCRKVFIVTIGDKSTQSEDVKCGHRFIKEHGHG